MSGHKSHQKQLWVLEKTRFVQLLMGWWCLLKPSYMQRSCYANRCFGMVSHKRQQHAATQHAFPEASTIYAPNLGWICAKFLTWTKVQMNLEQKFPGTSYKLRTCPNIKSSTHASWHVHPFVPHAQGTEHSCRWRRVASSERKQLSFQIRKLHKREVKTWKTSRLQGQTWARFMLEGLAEIGF